MKTTHRIHFKNARRLEDLAEGSVHLTVTSPPYPMIEMWDDCFTAQRSDIRSALRRGRGRDAFELMHQVLDPVWDEVYRALVPGGIACVNIGDATRTLNDRFILYPNHTRILTRLTSLGFTPLPSILWRKQTNAPNKFMGSGMLPPGAYLTLEHEYVLIVRKGGRRTFKSDAEKINRRLSAYFWEERNQWFSDVWMDLKGTRQKLASAGVRDRSGAYPFELPYRLIHMFSVKGDTVLDPFAGIGTTMAAAMAAGRNSVGYEIEPDFKRAIRTRMDTIVSFSNQRIEDRLEAHLDFVETRYREKGPFKYLNRHYGFPVVTRQEKELMVNSLKQADTLAEGSYRITYSESPQPSFCGHWKQLLGPDGAASLKARRPNRRQQGKPATQLRMF